MLALARFGGQPAVVVGQQRVVGGLVGPRALREARRGMALAAGLRLPLVLVIDTAGPALSAEAEQDGLAGEIARCLAELVTLDTPTVSVLLGQGSGGPALAMVPADRVLAALHGWLAPLPPEGASAIVFRDVDHAPELAAAQGIRSADLMRNGIVDAIVPEHPDAADTPRSSPGGCRRPSPTNLADRLRDECPAGRCAWPIAAAPLPRHRRCRVAQAGSPRAPEQFGRPAPRARATRPVASKPGLHGAAEPVPLESLAPRTASWARRSSRSVNSSPSNPSGSGCGAVADAQLLDGARDDVAVPVRQPTGLRRRHQPGPIGRIASPAGPAGTTAMCATDSTQPRSSRSGSSKTCNWRGRSPRTPAFTRSDRSTASASRSPGCRKVPGSAHPRVVVAAHLQDHQLRRRRV